MLIKVFPASLLTPKFIQEIRGPIPSVQCFPTGGIALNQVSSWLQAGAAVVGVGGALLQLADSTQGYGIITQRAHQLLVSLSHLEQQGMDTKDN